jgi:predicted acetyltransferase
MIAPATSDEQTSLRQLLELYQYDFSEFNRADVGGDGRYGWRNLDALWTAPERHPFLFRVDGHLAGFAIVRTGDPTDMAEFFVMRKYRRSGIGIDAARAVFSAFPGAWQTRQQFANTAATAFWRRAIPVPFVEHENDEGPFQQFTIS